ncbi:AAA family ATPase [Paenibacillus sp. 7124]|uniref:AAA family ATPase n=1 Tax=Paenibacillus apii TaxID=1850370 RepID=A0A6M1PG83_9BACL|nr:AAA family ATPase [Paenibacillus apii]NGM81255.1 AAA family ATPase [Paenibacillus apii]
MAAHGQQLLSKIIDTGDVQAITRLGIKRTDYATDGERLAHDFVVKYAAENAGAAPSLATFVTEFPDDVCAYIPSVTDSFEYLAREIKNAAGKRAIAEVLGDAGLQDEFDGKSAEEFAGDLTKKLERIKMETRTGVRSLVSITEQRERFEAEFDRRKAGESFRIWPSKFPSINTEIGGGYMSSNMYVWYGRSGRGKSIFVMEEAIESAFNGATVLIWALEMSWYEWVARFCSSASARLGTFNANFNGADYAAGFENRSLLTGKLDGETETSFRDFLRQLNGMISGKIIVKAINDPDFTTKTVNELEAQILETEADVVVVDPVYYMDFEANTSKTTGGDLAATSKKLRIMTGRAEVVLHAITQADETDKESDDDEAVRELMPPRRKELSKAKQLLHDAANTIGIDTNAREGRGVIMLRKGRSGGEDFRAEVVFLPNYGIVQEIDTAGQAAQFADVSGF